MSSLPVWGYELHYIAQRDEIHSIGILDVIGNKDFGIKKPIFKGIL